MSSPLLEVRDLTVQYETRDGWFTALRDVSLQVDLGRSLGIVGESGSGKSTLALALLGLLPKTARVEGSIRFDGTEIVGASGHVLNEVRGREIGLVYQDALVSLNPVRNVGSQIVEVIRRHRPGISRKDASRVAVEALSGVGIPAAAERAAQFPHQFSGGMRQRAAIAMALAAEPRLLVADEITTALDVTVQSQILDLLLKIREDTGMSTLVISHDLEVVRGVTDQVAVMYAGRLVEQGPAHDVLVAPEHPYTFGLVESAPTIERPVIAFIPGSPPTGGADVQGCAFVDRCQLNAGREICHLETPPLRHLPGTASVRGTACHFAEEMPSTERAAPETISTTKPSERTEVR